MIHAKIKFEQFPGSNEAELYRKSSPKGCQNNLNGAMNRPNENINVIDNSCSKNDCIINQVCPGFLFDNGSANKFTTDSSFDSKNNEDFKLDQNLIENLQNKLKMPPGKSLTNSWKKTSEVGLSSPYFHAVDNTYSEAPTIFFDVLKSDALQDSTSNQIDDALCGNGILFFEKEYCPEKTILKDKLNNHGVENVNDKSTLSSVPFIETNNFTFCSYYPDRDLVFELDEKLQISQIQEVNCEGRFLPEEVIEVPLDIYEENLDMLKHSRYRPIPQLICSDDEDVPHKQLKIKKNFSLKIFDVKNSQTSLHKQSNRGDKFHIENTYPFSYFKIAGDLAEHTELFKLHCNANDLSGNSVLWNYKFDSKVKSVDLSKHKEEFCKIKKFPMILENSYSTSELEPKSKWKSSFKPVPSPQCKIIRNVESLTCNFNDCGAEFFSWEELDDHTKNQHCETDQILENRSPSCDVSDDDENGDAYFEKEIKSESSSFIEENGEGLKESCKRKRKRLDPILFNFKDRLIKCGRFDCSVKFSSMDNLKQHIACHDFSNFSTRCFKCILCKKFFYKWANCCLHLWKAHGMDIDLLACGICKTYKTNLLWKMTIHQEVHSNEKFYKCETCGKIFKQNSQLKTHICKQKPLEEQPLWAQKTLCNVCSKWFTSYKNYVQHYNAIHLKIKKFACSHCNYQCYRKIQFTTHMRKHTKQKPYTCELCGLSVADHNSIRRHRLTHIPKRKFECPLSSCSYSTVNLSVFKMHLLNSHSSKKFRFTCQMCSFACSSLSEYSKHKNSHEEEFLKNTFPEVYSKNIRFSDSEESNTLKHDGVVNSKSKKSSSEKAKATSNDISTSKINNTSKLKMVEADTEASTLNDLYYGDKWFVKKRKLDRKLDFESVLLIE